MTRIGLLVTARAFSGTSAVITLNAPTFAPFSIVTGATNTELEPIFALSQIVVLLFSLVNAL